MCGRYTLSISVDEVWEDFDLEGDPPADDPRFAPRYNVAPTQEVPIIAARAPKKVRFFRWGLVPFWADDPSIGNKMINARSESVPEKPAFRRAFEKRRCVALADGFYEWRRDGKKSRTPFYVRLSGGRPFGLAGVWEAWKPKGDEDAEMLRTFTILTCDSKGGFGGIHHRMPVILTGDALARWLDDAVPSDDVKDLLDAVPDERLEWWEVSKLVNKPDNDAPECLARVEPSQPRELSLFDDT